jgi:hypothetical protein
VAWYKNPAFLKQSAGTPYDVDHPPGNPAHYAGIYRCMGCGREIAIAYNHALPPQNHHQHSVAEGAIRWRLAVWADHRPASAQL